LNQAIWRAAVVYALLTACLLGFARQASTHSASAGVALSTALQAVEEEESHQHESLFRWINFLLLVGGLTYLLRRPIADFFARRSVAVRTALEEGRRALESAQAQLRAVEEKLRQVEEEIAALNSSARREVESERERLREATAKEAERILESAEARFVTAVRAARSELKSYIAVQALELAEQVLRQRLNEAAHARLVSDFVARVRAKAEQN